MNKKLSSQNRHIIPISADGNCLFRSISYGLFCAEDHHHQIRTEIADYIRYNPEVFKQYIDTNDPFDEFVRKLQGDGEWAGHPCIYASALKYESLILEYQSERYHPLMER